jgi:hypothetical protein
MIMLFDCVKLDLKRVTAAKKYIIVILPTNITDPRTS